MTNEEIKRELTNVLYTASGMRTAAIQAFEGKDYRGAIEHASKGISLIENAFGKYPPALSEIADPYLVTFYGVRASAQYEWGRASKNAELLRCAQQDAEKAVSFRADAYTTRGQRPAMQQLLQEIRKAQSRIR